VAFQGKQPFFAFLRGAAGVAVITEAAPAENYILDERVSESRETDFLSLSGFDKAQPASRADWYEQHTNYTRLRVARCGSPHGALAVTFTSENIGASLDVNPAEDVVRVETIEGLCGLAQWLSAADARALIQRMLDARGAGQPIPLDVEAQLKKWLKKANDSKDSRPSFVAPFAEVEPLLKRPDWPNRLRDALGLGHIRATSAGDKPILLMQYSLERVRVEYFGAIVAAWAASPTVLDDVAQAGPSPHFFPAPASASSGYGFTVDLDVSDATFKREFLHAPIAYELRDIQRIGLVTTDVTMKQIENARSLHRSLLQADLKHFGDLLLRP
jgi:hypothetical protein